MQPSDLSRLIQVGNPRLSPDGGTIAYVVERVDMDASCYRSAIWLAAADASTPPVQFSAGADSDGGPAWSPDGRRLAFTRSRATPGGSDDESARRHQLLVAPVDGPGEVVTVAASKEEAFNDVTWSPDGQLIAYTQRVRDQRYEPDDERLRPPRRIDRIWNRLDSVGWTVDRRSHVFVAAVDGTTTPRQLTDGGFDHGAPAWSPDSSRLVTAAARHENWDLEPVIDLWVVDVARSGSPECITEAARVWDGPAWSPDGARIAALVTDWHSSPRHVQVAVVDPGSGSSTVLTAGLDRHCSPMPGARPPIWLGDHALLFSVEDRGRVPLMRVATDGSSAPEVVADGDRWVTGFDATADGTTVAFSATALAEPPELFAIADGHERRITTTQRGFLATCPPHPTERLAVPSPAGDGDIDAWLVRPPGFASDQRYPMLLQVHGGPATQHGERWFDEVQLYASAGYVVVYANPHGSTGFTEAWSRAIRSPLAKDDPGSGWGGVDFDDLMAVVDTALENEPAIDPDRVGILGGSYGGYMTSWALSHTDRFAAGCSERACNNLLTEEWTCDVPGLFRWEFGVDPFDHADEYLRMSPVSYVQDINTPILILHSEEDLRCHVEQADQLYVMLRLLGREVEYWRFPAESHELSRSGSPVHRRQRAEIILEWFDRWLRPGP
ncbi:MAG: S9 family peptidase [Acidimicrobiales bacterium]